MAEKTKKVKKTKNETKDNVIKAKVESEEIKDSIIKVNLSKPGI